MFLFFFFFLVMEHFCISRGPAGLPANQTSFFDCSLAPGFIASRRGVDYRSLDGDGWGVSDDEAARDFLPGEEDAMARLAQTLRVHRSPPVMLGSGRTTLVDKFCAVVHTLYLEAGCPASLHVLCKQFVCFTTDLGVEFGLPSVRDTELANIMPWAISAMPVHASEQPDECIPESTVGFSDSLAMPGLLHIIHNASNALLEVMPHLDAAVTQLSDVAVFLRTPETAKRLPETCYSTSVGRLHRAAIKSFDSKVHRSRWCTIAHCVEQLLGLRKTLTWGWGRRACAQAGNGSNRRAIVEVQNVSSL